MPFSYLSLLTGNYDIAQALHVSDAQAAARWTERTGRPSIYSPLDVLDRARLVARRRRLELTQRATRSCSAVTVPNGTAADELWRWLGVEGRVIHPGVDVSGPYEDEDSDHTVFCAANAEDQSGWAAMVKDAFARVARDQPDARLALLASTRQAPVRTLASGAPIVAPDLPETRELVNDPSVGRIFRGTDPDLLARMMCEALELAADPATPANCRKRAEDFSVDRCVERHLELYRQLLAAA